MADENLESNLIIRSRLEKPEGTGFQDIAKGLRTIIRTLEKIESRTYRVRLELDAGALDTLGLSLVKKVKDAGTQAGQAAATAINNISTGNRQGVRTKQVTTTTATKKGPITSVTTTDTNRQGAVLVEDKQTTRQGKATKRAVSETDVVATESERLKTGRQRADAKAQAVAAAEARKKALVSDFLAFKRQEGTTPDEFRSLLGTDDTHLFNEGLSDRRNSRDAGKKKAAEDSARKAAERNAQFEKDQAQANKSRETAAKQQAAAQKKADSDALHDDRALRSLRRAEDRDALHDDRVKRGLEKERTKEGNTGLKERNQAAVSLGKQQTARSFLDTAESQGFKENGRSLSFNNKTGKAEETVSFLKPVRKGLAEYEATIVKVNLATNALTATTLKGAAAARAIGDSFFRAAEKVSVWLGATTIVFATIRGFVEMVRVIKDTEAATILLARVGTNLGDSFSEQFEAATRVKDRLVEISTITGGLADESLKAAAIFARSGQTEKEIIDSVTAALIASQVAELDVVSAAELLSSAYLQFNLPARDTLAILDQLNTLSNSYRVTTDGLFQAISRSGSVISQQGGRLTELAAITAVTSQVTARSGAEIGNAIKTIASNLERADTKALLFDKLSVFTVDADGKTKSYTQTLLELSLALDRIAESERNQIGVAVAGVRQRNILVAQLSHIVDAIEAENKTIFQSKDSSEFGSSLQELGRESGTLVSQLSRLQAEANGLVNVLSGPALDVASKVVTILSVMSQTLQSGGGLPGKLAAMAVVLGAVVVGLKYLTSSLVGCNIALEAKVLATYNNIAADIRSKTVMGNLTVAAARVTVAIRGLTASLIANYGPQLLIAAAIYLVIEAYQYYIEKAQLLTEINNLSNETALKQIDAERRKAQAYEATTRAVVALITESEKLDRIRPGGGDENRRKAERLKKSAGLTSDIKGNSVDAQIRLEDESLQKQQTTARNSKLRLRQLQELNRDRANDIFKRGQKEADFDLNIRNDLTGISQLKLKSRLGKELKAGAGGSQRVFIDSYLRTRQAATEGDAEAQKDITEFTKEAKGGSFLGTDDLVKVLEKLGAEFIDVAAEADKLAAELAKVNAEEEALTEKINDNNRATVQARRNIGEQSKELRDFQKRESFFQDVRDPYEQIFGSESSVRGLENRIAKSKAITDKLKKTIADAKIEGTPLEKTVLGDLVNQENIERGLTNQLGIKQSEEQIGLTGRNLGRRSSLQEAALLSRRSQVESANPELFTGENSGLRQIEARQTASRRRIGELSGGEGNVFATQAANLEIQKELANLADLEIEKAKTLFQIEAEIAEARKKSADEAQRALGTLGEEDKLRALAQAKYFKDNPDKVLSVKEQFFADSRSVGLGRSLFGGHFGDRLTPDKSPFTSLFEGAGLGGSYSLDRAAKEAEATRAGRTDSRVIEDSASAAALAEAERSKLAGGTGVTPNYSTGPGGGFAGGNADVNLTVAPQLIDLTPLFSKFSGQLTEEVDRYIRAAEAAAEDAYQRSRRSKEPTVVGAE